MTSTATTATLTITQDEYSALNTALLEAEAKYSRAANDLAAMVQRGEAEDNDGQADWLGAKSEEFRAIRERLASSAEAAFGDFFAQFGDR